MDNRYSGNVHHGTSRGLNMESKGANQVLVGTSGYSYSEWKGLFYPKDMSARDYLRYYSEQFQTTEINNTFYRFPSQSATSGWKAQVPPEFRFSLKLTQKITHHKKLANANEEMNYFLEGVAPIFDQLAAILVQLPPYLRRDLSALAAFLEAWSSSWPLAFEFRHASWYDAEVYRTLVDHRASFVLAETEGRPAERIVTGPFIYIRLRKTTYEPPELDEWVQWIRQRKEPVFVYVKHDQRAPVLARELSNLLENA